MAEIKLPPEKTKVRRAIDSWVLKRGGYVTFTEFKFDYDRHANHHTDITISRLLKKYGRKDGPAGSRARWIIDGRVAAAVARDLLASRTKAPMEDNNPPSIPLVPVKRVIVKPVSGWRSGDRAYLVIPEGGNKKVDGHVVQLVERLRDDYWWTAMYIDERSPYFGSTCSIDERSISLYDPKGGE